MKKLISALLCISMILSLALPALAEAGEWTCSACGREHNMESFCPDCGAKKPEGLLCGNCGRQERSSAAKYCGNCGWPLRTENTDAGSAAPAATEPTEPAVLLTDAQQTAAASGDVFGEIGALLNSRKDYRVADAESALAIPELTLLVAGLSDPARELVSTREIHQDDFSGYRFAQYYEGLPVYGGEVIVSANGRGEEWFVASSFRDINSVSGAVVSDQTAADVICGKYGDSCEILGMYDCIYVSQDGSGSAQRVKQVGVSCPGFYGYAFTDGSSIVAEKALSVNYNSVSILDGNRQNTYPITKNIYYYADTEAEEIKYVEIPSDRFKGTHGRVFDYETGQLITDTEWTAEHIHYDQTLADVNGNEFSSLNTNDALYRWYQTELAELQNFVEEITGENFLEKYDVVIVSNALIDGSPNNAAASFPITNNYYLDDNLQIPRLTYMISMGTQYEGDRSETHMNSIRDILAHEFGHLLDHSVRYAASGPSLENGTIMEAIADIFGELYEAKRSTSKTCDWVHHSRNPADPASGVEPGPSTYMGENWDPGKNKKDFMHNNSTFISHMFCVLNDYGRTGGEGTFSTDELAKLLFRILQKLPVDCSFETFAQTYVYTIYEMYKDQPQKLKRAQNALWESGLNRFSRFCSVTGRVVDVSRNPIDSAKVTISDEDGKLLNTATTDRSGRYVFPYVPDGTYKVEAEVTMSDGRPDSSYVTVTAGGPLDHAEDLVLHCWLYTGTVIDSETAEPILQAVVSCGSRTAYSNETGSFRLLTSSPNQVTVSKDRYLDWNFEDNRTGFVHMTIPLEPDAQCSIYGGVNDKETNAPIPGATAWLSDFERKVAETVTDDLGNFRLDCLSGSYYLYISAPGYAQSRTKVEIIPNGVEQSVVYLDPILLEKALVRDAYSPELETYLSIPEVTLDTDAARALNEEMYSELFVQRQIYNYKMSYTWEISGDVLSISVKLWHDEWSRVLMSYALVLSEVQPDGQTLTPRQAMLASANYTEEDFFQTLREKAEACFDRRDFQSTMDVTIGMFGQSSQSEWEKAKAQTLSDENLERADVHLRDGSLYVDMQIYYPEMGGIYPTDYAFILSPKASMSAAGNQPAQTEVFVDESAPWLEEAPYPAPEEVTLSDAVSGEMTWGNWSYVRLEDDTVKITGCSNAEGVLEIPANIDGYDVSTIGEYAFMDTMITSAVIPDTVRVIGEGAFSRCTELTDAALPAQLLYLGNFAFSSCSKLQSIELPGSLGCHISEAVFENCTSIESVKLKPGITVIPGRLFSGCSGIQSIAIPKTVVEIGYGAFAGTSLRRVLIPGNVRTVEDSAFACETLTDVTIEPGVIKLGIAFADSQITELTVPEGVTDFGGSNYCKKLRTVHLPSTVTSLRGYAFSGCYALQSINIPEGVTEIPDKCFANCIRLTEITLPSGLTTIGKGAFENTSLRELYFSESITSIESQAFKDCRMLTIHTVPGSYAEQWSTSNWK